MLIPNWGSSAKFTVGLNPIKPANGSLMNHCDPLVVLKGVFSELILLITYSENCVKILLCFSQ